MISVTDREDEGISFTYGIGGRGGRFGGVGKGGLAILTGTRLTGNSTLSPASAATAVPVCA